MMKTMKTKYKTLFNGTKKYLELNFYFFWNCDILMQKTSIQHTRQNVCVLNILIYIYIYDKSHYLIIYLLLIYLLHYYLFTIIIIESL